MASFVKLRVWVRLWPRLGYGQVLVTEYTGRLVREALAKCSPRISAILSAPMGIPKPLSVSPLFRGENGRIEAIYPRSPDGERIVYPSIRPGELLHFYLGLGPGLEDETDLLLSCLDRGVDVDFSMHTVSVRLEKAEQLTVYNPEEKPTISLRGAESIRITLMSPTLPVNPWRPRSRWKRLLPAPSYLFSVNALELAAGDTGRAAEMLKAAERILSPPPTVYRTVKIRYYLHDGRPLPALTGYVKLFVETEGCGEDIEIVEHLLSHAEVMGVGSGRAAGYGVVSITTEGRARTATRG